MYNFRLSSKILYFFTLIVVLTVTGCNDNFLQENPKDQVSEEIFWQNEKQVHQALMGVYRVPQAGWTVFNGWSSWTAYFDNWTDVSGEKLRRSYPYEGLNASNNQVERMWADNYTVIGNANYFLENINKADMDETKKTEMIAEVKFLRAYSYFWLSQLYGKVPLIKKVLTFNEANSVSQASQEEVVSFAIKELTEAAKDLPVEQPPEEYGRIEKGAALALKGRFLMAEKQWSDAADTYKKIIELNRYSIDPRFKELFEDEGDNSDEIIFAKKYMQSELGDNVSQKPLQPAWYGGYGESYFYQNFVDRFLMTDGKSIGQSPLYDPDHPFENRDPRLYATVLLPKYSEVNGEIYQGHPDSINVTGQSGPGVTGYAVYKFWDVDYSGNTSSYGGDYKLIRYAEVLLSYLESELEAGNTITQDLLDNTINKVRGRDAVDMVPVTETNPNELMAIIRNERAVEFAMEGGIHYWDLLRWKRLDEVLNRKFYGVKITDTPGEYNGSYKINDKGHLFVSEKRFEDHYYLWPIPQSELDVNDNLEQNPGY